MSSEPTIRSPTREEVPLILSMMRATATEQGVPESVTATESDLLNFLEFNQSTNTTSPAGYPQPGTAGKATVLFIQSPTGEIAGMATYFLTFVAWTGKRGICLEDLYVKPEFRARGYARLLVKEIAKRAEELGCARVEWFCFKGNERALRFYHGLGARDMDSMISLRLDGEGLRGLAGES